MKTLTHEEETFVRAYARIVAAVPENVVRAYFELGNDEEEFYKHYDFALYGSSVPDAYLMWDAARQYSAEETK